MKVPRLYFLLIFVCTWCYSQNQDFVRLPKGANKFQFRNNNPIQNLGTNKTINSTNSISVYEQDRKRVEREKKLSRKIRNQYRNRINIDLPFRATKEETKYYRNAFQKLLNISVDSFSIKETTFITENAFYKEKQDYDNFNKIVAQTGSFLLEKMKELKYPSNSNLAKNLILFQFFADTLEIKSKNLKHLPFKYDFEDYKGEKNWSKMLVTKLLTTQTGQCHSLPQLYLILAEEIGAESFLSLSPNHSYIKFKDEKNKWYNIELTNGMFTTDTYILQSGYITSEALQNGIYMQELTKKQLLSQAFHDLALGYVHQFGYDNFSKKIIDKSLELYPNSIHANQLLANYLTYQFEYVTRNQLGINPRNHKELQQISYYPEVVKLLNKTNASYNKVHDLGYKEMPKEMYENWLASLKQEKQKSDNRQLRKRFKLNIKTLKN